MANDCLHGSTDQCDSAVKRATLEQVDLSVSYNATDTYEILVNKVCPNVGALTKTITIYGSSGNYLRIPPCIVANATGLISITLHYFLIDDLSLIPSNVASISIQYSKFPNATLLANSSASPASPTYGPAQPTPPNDDTLLDGFDTFGNVSWSEIWSLFPDLNSLTMWQCGLYGLLPDVLPARINHMGFYYNELRGTISPNFMSLTPSSNTQLLSLWFQNNHLTGTIPEDLMAPFTGYPMTGTNSRFYLDFSGNELSGTIPPSLLYPLSGIETDQFVITFRDNELDGTIPSNLVPARLQGPLSSFVLDFGANNLVGSIPNGLFNNLTACRSFSFYLNDNYLTGTLSSHLLDNVIHNAIGLSVDLSGNKFTGTIPADLITGTLSSNLTVDSLFLKLNNNLFEGPIPENLLYKISSNKRDAYNSHTMQEGGQTTLDARDDHDALLSEDAGEPIALILKPMGQFSIQLDKNHLNGSIPPTLLKYIIPPQGASQCSLSLANNNLTGSIPPEFFTSVIWPSVSLFLELENNDLSGPLPSFCLPYTMPISLNCGQNDITGTIPDTYGSCSNIVSLMINQIPGLTGTIPESLVNNPNLTMLMAYGTSLQGTLPVIPSSIRVLYLWNSTFDFCSPNANSSFATYTGFCDLSYSEACNCLDMYEGCTATCTENAVCTPGTQPSPDFRCLDGQWVAASITVEKLEVPNGAGTVIVKGNLTTTTINLRDLESSVAVTGCVSNLTTIDVGLNSTDVAKLSTSKKLQTLVAQAGSDGYGAGCMSLEPVALTTKATTNSCKKVKSEKQTSNSGTTLSTYWSLNTNSCNTWWIILASVLCGVAIIVVVAVILVTCFSAKAKMHFRPFVASEGVFMKPST